MNTNLERAGQAVAEAWGRVYRLAAGQQGVEPKGLDAALNGLVCAVRELAACEIEAAQRPLPDDLEPGWWDTRDRDAAARIAREGLTKEN